jgi:hypothetical protein
MIAQILEKMAYRKYFKLFLRTAPGYVITVSNASNASFWTSLVEGNTYHFIMSLHTDQISRIDSINPQKMLVQGKVVIENFEFEDTPYTIVETILGNVLFPLINDVKASDLIEWSHDDLRKLTIRGIK